MASSPREVGAAPRFIRDSGSSANPFIIMLLRFKDLKYLTLLNARDPATYIVWWLYFKAEACNKERFTEFWSATSTCSDQHHARIWSILSQIIQDNQAKTKLLRFVSSVNPQCGRRAVDALLNAFLPTPRSRSTLLNQAMYLKMTMIMMIMLLTMPLYISLIEVSS
jgi:hypothetical protein